MAGFNTFLLNEGRSKRIDELEAIDIFKSNCKQYRWEQVVFRGIETASGQYNKVDPRVGGRVSANTQNYYTLWMDNSPAWRQYPKRSESLICSTDVERGYGKTYLVIPYDGARIAICPANDLWFSFKGTLTGTLGLFRDLDSFNMFIYNVAYQFSEKKFKRNELGANVKSLKKILKEADEVMLKDLRKTKEQLDGIGYGIDAFNAIKDHGGLTGVMDYVLDPKANDFEVMPFTKYKGSAIKSEVWTDSPALLVEGKQVVIEDFKKAVE